MSGAQHTHPWFQPAEWQPQSSVWMAWPWDAPEWAGEIDAARREIAEMARLLARDQRVDMLVHGDEAGHSAKSLLGDTEIVWHQRPYGDVWLRDTGPVFLRHRSEPSSLAALRFHWTGWAGKFLFDNDDTVAPAIAELAGAPVRENALAAEGGAVEVDGQGTVLTSRQCLLHPDRNRMDEASVSRALCEALGATRVLWLDQGLANDHTDGHIDTLARFVRPGQVVCAEASADDDPNKQVLKDIRRQLEGFTDATGKQLDVVRLPSPGRIENKRGELLAASYCNFYIGNGSVVVPTYGVSADHHAVSILAQLFADREVVGLPARAVVSGGGAFHCISQQQPAVASPQEPT